MAYAKRAAFELTRMPIARGWALVSLILQTAFSLNDFFIGVRSRFSSLSTMAILWIYTRINKRFAKKLLACEGVRCASKLFFSESLKAQVCSQPLDVQSAPRKFSNATSKR